MIYVNRYVIILFIVERKMSKIGIFGGSFNPMHIGHIVMAELFSECLGLDKIIVIPAGVAPHKENFSPVDGEKRLEMCRLSVADISACEVSDIELRRGGKSYTIDTVREVARLYPGSELYLLTGSDMFLTFDSWKDFKDILDKAVICTVARNGEKPERLLKFKKELEKLGGRCIILDGKIPAVSSTDIRRMAENGRSVSGFVHENVEKYIKDNHIYGL